MNKKILTNKDRLQSLKERADLIKGTFQKNFNKIKRLDEDTTYQGLDELDYNNLYSNTDANDSQTAKIDDLPNAGKHLNHWLDSAQKALNGSREERHRFLMDDTELQQYYNKLSRIKSALDKSESGEELDDLDRRIVKYYKTNKGSQNGRIRSMAKNKIEGDYVNNFQDDANIEGQTFEVFNNITKENDQITITGSGVAKKERSDVKIQYPFSHNDKSGILSIFADGSSGFDYDEPAENGITQAYIRFTERPEFVTNAANKLNKILPNKNN